MKKVFINAVYKTNKDFNPVNVSAKDTNDVYINNSFVSLYTAKKNNPECDACLVVNFELDKEIVTLFKRNDIDVRTVNNSIFDFPSNFKWAPAFFKLDALNLLANDYDQLCILDTDTIIVGPCHDMWKESESTILLYDVDYSLCSPKRKITIEVAQKYFNCKRLINHWGGEIVVGTSEDVKVLINGCLNVYKEVIKDVINLNTGFGQEALLSIAIDNTNLPINRANKYCQRYWTRTTYLIDTNYINIPIWHLPAEKDLGLIKVYKKIIKGDRIPANNKLAQIFFLKKKMNTIHRIIYFSHKLKQNPQNIKKIFKINKPTSNWIDK